MKIKATVHYCDAPDCRAIAVQDKENNQLADDNWLTGNLMQWNGYIPRIEWSACCLEHVPAAVAGAIFQDECKPSGDFYDTTRFDALPDHLVKPS